MSYYWSFASYSSIEMFVDESRVLIFHEPVIILIELEVSSPEFNDEYLQMRTAS
jgi:hypothetical protein